jgi:parallel beta-helix repeat protein
MRYLKTGVGLGQAVTVAFLVTYGGSTPRADASCGATIVDDLRLEHDLACAGDGLAVGADRIRIDLNGHMLAGGGTGAGITVTGRTDVTISGGIITGFAVGIRVSNSTDLTVKQNEFDGNPEGIDFQAGSVGNTVKDNVFINSATRAIMMRGNVTDNDIRNNRFTGNRIGILIFGGVGNTVKDNVVSGSTVAGIRLNVLAAGNVIKANTLTTNAAAVEFLVTTTGSAVGNEVKDNSISTNGCGVKGPTGGNELKANLFDGNVVDSCS